MKDPETQMHTPRSITGTISLIARLVELANERPNAGLVAMAIDIDDDGEFRCSVGHVHCLDAHLACAAELMLGRLAQALTSYIEQGGPRRAEAIERLGSVERARAELGLMGETSFETGGHA